MHTTKIGDSTFQHDASDRVRICRGEDSVTIPLVHLTEFIAERVRTKRIAKLEDMEADELLGI